ncbi:MAG: hypothetical protein K6E97_04800 [Treponema sp.]|nr:hypothetical protein [Treponema sp.]
MRIFKSILSFIVLSIAATLCSCHIDMTNSSNDDSGNGEETPAQSSYKAGDIALAKIKIGDIEYENTAQVYVTGKDGATIQGKTNTDNDAGVFIEDRKVSLSPFIMSKYEVTRNYTRP